MRYRADIDGLRAVAVVPVVLGHAGVGLFGGGFVGVDVFFVISGYLITGILLQDLDQGRFSIAGFYDRRIRRIFPALFVVLAGTLGLTALLFLPSDFQRFSQSLIAAALFSTNMLFWDQVNYFDASADVKPLLHTWSLSVEEQFYLLFPLLLAILYRLGRRRLAQVLAAVLVVSLIGSIGLVRPSPRSAFYLAPLRAWELMLGAILATGVVPGYRRTWLREAAALAGLGLILAAVFTFSDQTLFPGLSAIIPCLGTAFILHAGEDGRPLVGRILSRPAIVFIGLISYSLYLWHWPLLSAARYYNVRPLDGRAIVAVLGVSLVLATLSWRFVERPFRGRAGWPARPVLFRGAAWGSVICIGLGLAGQLSGGWPSRVPEQVRTLASFADSINPRRAECFSMREEARSPAGACVYGAPRVVPTWALWGDSHSDPLIAPLGARAAQFGAAVRYFGHGGCAPVVEVERWDKPHQCIAWNGAVLQSLLADTALEHVVLVARWSSLLNGRARSLGPAERTDLDPILGDRRGPSETAEAARALFARQLILTIDALLSRHKEVYLITPIPETGYDIPTALARMAWHGDDPASFTVPTEAYRRRHRDFYAIVDRLPASPRLHLIHPEAVLCDSTACSVIRNGKPLYSDDDHLSLPGAARVVALLDPAFARGRPPAGRGAVDLSVGGGVPVPGGPLANSWFPLIY